MKLPEHLNSIHDEFIGIDDNLYQVKIELVHFVDFKASTKLKLQQLLEDDMVAQISLDEMGIVDNDKRLHQFGLCRFGGFDNKADIEVEGNTNHEYYACSVRGICKAEGKLCRHIKTKNGFLTPREIDTIKLIAQDLADKEIADKLGISVFTVNTHRKHIQDKIGANSKVGICRFAVEKRII